MTRQRRLFENNELPLSLRKLTDPEIEALGIKHFGNIYYYYPDQIKALVLDVQKRLEGRNRA
jgi:hypothetical protein